jgi:coenzyme F420-reducing hydrogenase delta subunit
MTVKELMERVGSQQTGKVVAYVKDALEEIQMLTETHVRRERIDITEDQRFYTLPNEMVKMIDIRVKNHLNSKDEYRTIPRMIHKPIVKDADNT